MQRQNINTKGLTIIPEETLEFIVDKKSQTSESKILIYNSSNIDVAYKIKSSSPKDFTFLKSEGLVSSNSKLVITIVYSFSEQSYYKFHKFLLQTANIKNEQLENIDWKTNGVHEYKLCAKFVDKQDVQTESPKESKIIEKVEKDEKKFEEKTAEKKNFKKTEVLLKKNEKTVKNKTEASEKNNYKAIHLFLSFCLGSLFTYLITNPQFFQALA